jgi:hypothetical protein
MRAVLAHARAPAPGLPGGCWALFVLKSTLLATPVDVPVLDLDARIMMFRLLVAHESSSSEISSSSLPPPP